MKKILLVRCEESRTKYDFKGIIENEPLDLEIIYGLLTDKYDVSIFDLQVEKISFKKYIEDNYSDVLIIEGRCFQENFMLEYAELFKKKYGNTVIITGQHAQINPHRFYKDYIDYVLSGYNYYDLDSIINGEYKDIFNLSYKLDNKWISNRRKETDINLLPDANREYFYNHKDNYQYLDMKHAMWIRSSFSCPYKCEFCIRRLMNNSKYSRRSYISLADEIERNNNEVLYIVDDDFLYDEKYLEDFINEIRKRNISRKYICYGRTDFIAKHEELMKQFKEMGLVYVLAGLEDISDKRLINYNKLNVTDNNLKCIDICKKYRIRLMAMFILGLDYRPIDFNELYRYIVRHDLKHVAVSIYTPEMGLDHNIEYIDDNPSHFDYLHLVSKPINMSVRRYYFNYYKLLIKLFLKAHRDHIYDFIDYKDYIRSFIHNIFFKRVNDDA